MDNKQLAQKSKLERINSKFYLYFVPILDNSGWHWPVKFKFVDHKQFNLVSRFDRPIGFVFPQKTELDSYKSYRESVQKIIAEILRRVGVNFKKPDWTDLELNIEKLSYLDGVKPRSEIHTKKKPSRINTKEALRSLADGKIIHQIVIEDIEADVFCPGVQRLAEYLVQLREVLGRSIALHNQQFLLIIDERDKGRTINELQKFKFFGLPSENFLFMYRKLDNGSLISADHNRLYTDTVHTAKTPLSYAEMIYQTAMDDQIFYKKDKLFSRVDLNNREFMKKLLNGKELLLSTNASDGNFTFSLERLAVALKTGRNWRQQTRLIIDEDNSENKYSYAIYQPLAFNSLIKNSAYLPLHPVVNNRAIYNNPNLFDLARMVKTIFIKGKEVTVTQKHLKLLSADNYQAYDFLQQANAALVNELERKQFDIRETIAEIKADDNYQQNVSFFQEEIVKEKEQEVTKRVEDIIQADPNIQAAKAMAAEVIVEKTAEEALQTPETTAEEIPAATIAKKSRYISEPKKAAKKSGGKKMQKSIKADKEKITINSLIKKYPELNLNSQLIQDMKKKNIDIELTLERITKANAGAYDGYKPIKAKALPEIDGVRVIEANDEYILELDFKETQTRIDGYNLPKKLDLKKYGIFNKETGKIFINSQQLKNIGQMLAPIVAYGMLNGGSASSYVDKTSNTKSYSSLVDLYRKYFDAIADMAKDLPKGSTPAYVNPNGSLGYNFMEMRERALLIKALKYKLMSGVEDLKDIYPMFQMTSDKTHKELQQIIDKYDQSEILKDLIEFTGKDSKNVRSKMQPVMAVWTQDKPYQIFSEAYGKKNSTLAMPGGHGHNFYVMKEIYKELYDQGYRVFYLGNVDNPANVVNDKAVALLGLTGKPALFEFTIKTKADVKGGIALVDENDVINCGDIGPAVSKEEVKSYEEKGLKILFNPASGYFNAEWLIDNLDNVIDNLPMRTSPQDKDAGKYRQAEQVTWEIMGMIPDKIILAVDKYDRFIAAKMLVELLMASKIDDIDLNDPTYPPELREIALNLQRGLEAKLTKEYGMKLVDGVWLPKSIDELVRDLNEEITADLNQKKKVQRKGKKANS